MTYLVVVHIPVCGRDLALWFFLSSQWSMAIVAIDTELSLVGGVLIDDSWLRKEWLDDLFDVIGSAIGSNHILHLSVILMVSSLHLLSSDWIDLGSLVRLAGWMWHMLRCDWDILSISLVAIGMLLIVVLGEDAAVVGDDIPLSGGHTLVTSKDASTVELTLGISRGDMAMEMDTVFRCMVANLGVNVLWKSSSLVDWNPAVSNVSGLGVHAVKIFMFWIFKSAFLTGKTIGKFLDRGLGFGVWGLGFGVWEIGRAHV